MVLLVTVHAPQSLRISGILIDANDHGFRVRHQYEGFNPNDVVNFIHRLREGVARVVWHERIGADFETGFSYFEE